MLLLGIDLETGGSFDAPLEENFITEIGAVLWSTDHGPVKIFSEIIDVGKDICEEAEEYTGITNAVRGGFGLSEAVTPQLYRAKIREFIGLMASCDYVVAHNGLAFDKPILSKFLGVAMPQRTWVDTMIDIPFPGNCTSRNLSYLAAFHLILNCFPHRAVTDVLTMMSILTKYDINKVVECAETPIVEAAWSAPYPSKFKYKGDASGYARAMKEFNRCKELARKNKFRWQPENKEWCLKTRKHLIPEIDLPFELRGLPNEEKS